MGIEPIKQHPVLIARLALQGFSTRLV